eukprot:scaffold3366_cov39-Phaeocystis_antarctica.AAC.1
MTPVCRVPHLCAPPCCRCCGRLCGLGAVDEDRRLFAREGDNWRGSAHREDPHLRYISRATHSTAHTWSELRRLQHSEGARRRHRLAP